MDSNFIRRVRLSVSSCAAGLLSLLLASHAAAGEPSWREHWPASAQLYADRMRTLSPAPAPVAVESLFVLASRAAAELTNPPESDGLSAVEAMNDSTAALASELLPGLTLILGPDQTGAVPCDSFFLDLSLRRGTPVDIAFFRARIATLDPWGMPLWIEQTWDYGGCTRFGSGAIVDAWATWDAFARRHPGRYATAVQEDRDGCERELLKGDCVCGRREDLLLELHEFVRRFPKRPLAPKVLARIRAVERSAEPVREHCRPG